MTTAELPHFLGSVGRAWLFLALALAGCGDSSGSTGDSDDTTVGSGGAGAGTGGAATGGGMTTGSSMSSGDGGGGGGTACTDTCTLSAKLCDGDAVRTCIQDGDCTRLSDAIPCTNGQVCSGGACVDECTDQCTVAETQCSGVQLQTCETQGSGCTDFSLPEACPTNEACTGGTCELTCTDQCPNAGDKQCVGDAVETCALQGNGCLDWSSAVDCPTNQSCVGGTCMTCTNGMKRCSTNDDVEECLGGLWYTDQSCAFGCNNSACLTQVTCTPGTHQCNGGTVEVCNSTGTAFLYTQTCAATCSGGLCTGQCTPGTKRCNGMNVEQCNGAGNAYALLDPCSTFCDDATASCAIPALDITANTNLDGVIVVDGPVVIHSGATLNSPTGNLTIRAPSITVQLGASITVAPTGNSPGGAGGFYGCCGCGGAGAGYGTAGNYNSACGTTGQGPAWGSTPDAEVFAGSRGGNSHGGTLGGMGGGVLRLIATTIDVAGTITANGTNGANGGSGGGGGGSGGGILLAANSLSMTGIISAAGGAGGSFSSGYAGASGGSGRVKLLYGTTVNVTGTVTGVKTQGLLPPITVASSTHPDASRIYNDDFPLVAITWERPFSSAQGYYYTTNTTNYAPPTPATGLFTPTELMTVDRSLVVQGTNYFHVVSVDPMSAFGLIENRFPIQVNTVPPTVASSSHPSETAWNANMNAFFSWTLPNADANHQGYLYVLDHYGDTVPTTAHTFLPVGQKQVLLSNLTAGVWAFHVVSVDQRGYRTKAARHYKVRIGADPGNGSILGTVSDGGTPILGATVRVNRSLIGTNQSTIANGSYNFGSVIPAGSWEVEVSKVGFQTQTQMVNVTMGNSTTANFTLQP